MLWVLAQYYSPLTGFPQNVSASIASHCPTLPGGALKLCMTRHKTALQTKQNGRPGTQEISNRKGFIISSISQGPSPRLHATVLKRLKEKGFLAIFLRYQRLLDFTLGDSLPGRTVAAKKLQQSTGRLSILPKKSCCCCKYGKAQATIS